MTRSLRTIARSIRGGSLSARRACEECLELLEAGADLGAFWHVDAARALEAADSVDRMLAAGVDPGPLCGVPIAAKDAFAVAGMPGGAGGPEQIARRDAVAVGRLRRAGAILVGTCAMHQLGWGMSGQTPGRATCRNPLDRTLQPGGSSSGSAVAVAAGIVPLALGGDTGGSVRQPAAWCRVVGYKPAQRTIPRTGLIPLSPALDTVGWLTADVDGSRLAAEVLGEPVRQLEQPVRGLRLGIDRAVLEASDPTVAAAVDEAVRGLERQGARLVPLPLPGLPARLGALYAADLAAAWHVRAAADPESFGADVHAGIEAGLRVSAVAYLEARAAREHARSRTRLAGVDAVVCPTCPLRPPRLEAPDDVRRAGLLTRPFNLLDWPAISVPVGDEAVGLQIAVPRGAEPVLWTLAAAAERG
jgi:Asp-tRNA(Asn)/Glu-tRNA(Gln) amidotransferase A subunit family amidase